MRMPTVRRLTAAALAVAASAVLGGVAPLPAAAPTAHVLALGPCYPSPPNPPNYPPGCGQGSAAGR